MAKPGASARTQASLGRVCNSDLHTHTYTHTHTHTHTLSQTLFVGISVMNSLHRNLPVRCKCLHTHTHMHTRRYALRVDTALSNQFTLANRAHARRRAAFRSVCTRERVCVCVAKHATESVCVRACVCVCVRRGAPYSLPLLCLQEALCGCHLAASH